MQDQSERWFKNFNHHVLNILGFKNQTLFFRLAETLSDTVFITGMTGHIMFMNTAGLETFGLTGDSLEGGLSPDVLFIPADHERLKKALSLPEDESREYTAIRKNGGTFPALVRFHPMVNGTPLEGTLGLIVDTSEQNAMAEKLRKEQRKLQDIFENMWDSYVLVDLEGNFLETSLVDGSAYNIPENRLTGLNVMDFMHEDQRGIMTRNFREVLEKGRLHGVEHVKLKDGQTRSFEFNKLLVYENDNPVAIRMMTRDVTEEVNAKRSLEISEARYRSVFENTGLPTIILEDGLLISKVNARFEELSGYTRNAIEGHLSFFRFMADQNQEEVAELLAKSRESSFELECRLVNREGTFFDMIMQVGHISNTRQKVVSFFNITSRKQAEAQLLECSVQLQNENQRLRSSMKERYRFGNIIGKSPLMQEIYESIVKAAETHANVVIYGESGTGKELVAREIHNLSNRKKNNFVTVNCGAVPDTIIESEFFGYKKGAFTGAYTDKPGYLDFADGGTLFLDEVGEINLSMQVKLLRIIDTGDYIPLGSTMGKKTDVRIIAATNRDLRSSINQGLIREDFFYRVHIIPIHLPPLRERKEDIPLLIEHFLSLYGGADKNIERLLIDQFLDYDWPGNVRELQNVVHRYISMNKIDFSGSARPKQSIPAAYEAPNDSLRLADLMASYEKDVIRKTLIRHHWHRGKAAETLGVNRKTLFTKINKYGLDKP